MFLMYSVGIGVNSSRETNQKINKSLKDSRVCHTKIGPLGTYFRLVNFIKQLAKESVG